MYRYQVKPAGEDINTFMEGKYSDTEHGPAASSGCALFGGGKAMYRGRSGRDIECTTGVGGVRSSLGYT